MERQEITSELVVKKEAMALLATTRQEKLLFWKTRILSLSNILVDHINRFGFCVIDHFLGANLCSYVHQEANSRNTTSESPGIKQLLMILDCLVKQSGMRGLDLLGQGVVRGHVRIDHTSPYEIMERKSDDKSIALRATLFLSEDEQGGMQLHPLLKQNTMATIPPAIDRIVFYPAQKMKCCGLPSSLPGQSKYLQTRWMDFLHKICTSLRNLQIFLLVLETEGAIISTTATSHRAYYGRGCPLTATPPLRLTTASTGGKNEA